MNSEKVLPTSDAFMIANWNIGQGLDKLRLKKFRENVNLSYKSWVGQGLDESRFSKFRQNVNLIHEPWGGQDLERSGSA